MEQIMGINNGNGFEGNLKDYNSYTIHSENNVKTKFQIECETAVSIEEAEALLLSFVRSLPWKKLSYNKT